MLETMTSAVAAAKRGAPNTPIVPKLTGQLDNPLGVVRGIAEAGADGVVMFNRFTGLDIDLDSEQPVMHGGYAGHGGPWAIHFVLRWISETYPGLPIPIAASGGVTSGGDAAKLILAGATIVQVCTAIVMDGYDVVGRILGELAEWMERQGHETPADFRGAICSKVKTNDEVERAQDCVAQIDPDKCVNCGLCARVCIYGACGPDDPVGPACHVVSPEDCIGCGLCAEMCPVSAIEMADLPEPRTFELGVK